MCSFQNVSNSLFQTQAENMLEELFPLDGGEDGYTDSPLDQAVKRLSLELINDFPPADPRWAESVPQGMSNLLSSKRKGGKLFRQIWSKSEESKEIYVFCV